MANRTELATFLRTRRERLTPADVGLPGTARRRTPGLRRQEVAHLAGVSVDYYIRLEQGRGPRPSRQVLAALTRALMLTRDERDYLFRVAGESPPPPGGPSREVTIPIRYLLDNLVDTPAFVLDAKYDILAWNAMATHFIGDPAAYAPGNGNVVRWVFAGLEQHVRAGDTDTLNFARACVADLRAAYARYPGDRGIAELVTELLGTSARFAAMWAEHEVAVNRGIRKRMDHPVVGPVEYVCQVLHVADSDQRLITYCAEPGSPSHAAFRRLAGLPEITRTRRG
ncbi:helix-turn-helix transcriptional regulator [Luedemannella flava]|uniref:Helix-turn-helix transcriptional regulator n=1 Tax=Luedemannella flava TaxID=349316 RepID=A0ABN2LJB8_9ACTN